MLGQARSQRLLLLVFHWNYVNIFIDDYVWMYHVSMNFCVVWKNFLCCQNWKEINSTRYFHTSFDLLVTFFTKSFSTLNFLKFKVFENLGVSYNDHSILMYQDYHWLWIQDFRLQTKTMKIWQLFFWMFIHVMITNDWWSSTSFDNDLQWCSMIIQFDGGEISLIDLRLFFICNSIPVRFHRVSWLFWLVFQRGYDFFGLVFREGRLFLRPENQSARQRIPIDIGHS